MSSNRVVTLLKDWLQWRLLTLTTRFNRQYPMSCQKSDPCVCEKISGISTGPTVQVVRRKYMAKGCFDVQKNDFGERSTLFRGSFIINGLRECWCEGRVSFCQHYHEICYKIYRFISATDKIVKSHWLQHRDNVGVYSLMYHDNI